MSKVKDVKKNAKKKSVWASKLDITLADLLLDEENDGIAVKDGVYERAQKTYGVTDEMESLVDQLRNDFVLSVSRTAASVGDEADLDEFSVSAAMFGESSMKASFLRTKKGKGYELGVNVTTNLSKVDSSDGWKALRKELKKL